MSFWRFFLLVLLIFFSSISFAQEDYKKITGVYKFFSGSIGDPVPTTIDDLKIAIEVRGEAAYKIYQGLGKQAEQPSCMPEIKQQIRRKGDIACIKDGTNSYRCTFGLDLKEGNLINALIC